MDKFTQTAGTWGERLQTFSWENGLVTLLFLKAGKRCSWHEHKNNWNRFICVSGRVGIKTDKGSHITVLTPKQIFEVEPGLMHEFQVYEDSIVEEIVYTKFDEDDIIRESLGSNLSES